MQAQLPRIGSSGTSYFYAPYRVVLNLKQKLSAPKQLMSENPRTVDFLNGILEQSLAGIYVIENDYFSYVNQSFVDIFGYNSSEEIIGKLKIIQLVAPECRDMVIENVKKRTTGEINEVRYTFTGLRKDGARNIVEVHGRSMVSNGNRSVIGLILDMTNYERMSAMAFYDSLTKLPNRALFCDRIEQVIARARRNQENFALLFIDLDGFKKVNDNEGHAAGDLVLQQTAQRLEKLFRESDSVYRFGGDEFVAILTGTGDYKNIEQIAIKCIETLQRPFHFHQHSVAVSASIGISLFPFDGEETETLLHQADSAMYEAKTSGKNAYRFAGNCKLYKE